MGVYGVGRVAIAPNSAVAACIAYNSSIYNSTACTVGTGGVDSVAAGNTFFATINYALRTWTGGSEINCVSNITEAFGNIRNTDASQTAELLKVVRANGFTVTNRTSATFDPTTATYIQDGVQTNCWAVATGLTGSATVDRVLRMDQTDTYSQYKPFKKYASLALLNAAASDGFFYDTGTGSLALNMGTNPNPFKTSLKCMFLDTSGNSRLLNIGAAIALDGVRFEGVQMVSLDGGARRPEFWLHNCTQLWPTSKGWDGTVAGWFVETSGYGYSSGADMRNAFAASTTGSGLILTANTRYINSGDLNVFALDGTEQCVSAHGGSSHVSFGSTFVGANGQVVGDTCVASANDISWLVGCDLGPALDVTADNITFGSAAASASRKVYIDTCRSTKAGTNDLGVGANATVNIYNSPTIAVINGATSAYTPGSPP